MSNNPEDPVHKEAVAKLLRASFPDPQIQISPEAVSANLIALQHEAAKNPTLFQGYGFDTLAPTSPPVRPVKGDPRLVDYWMGKSTHHRTAPIESEFVACLAFARVTVSEDWQKTPIETAIGTMYAGDHKLYSQTVAEEYLSDLSKTMGLKFPALDRVQILSPARLNGARFGAIGIYLFYAEGSKLPFAYSLEAGMATGESRVLYFAPDFKTPILRRSYYHPTPLSDPNNKYLGFVTLTPEGNPKTLSVEVHKTDTSPVHMKVNVCYEAVSEGEVSTVFPAILTLQAACRVAAITEAAGVPFPDLGPLTPLFAQLGRELYPWVTKPGVKS